MKSWFQVTSSMYKKLSMYGRNLTERGVILSFLVWVMI